MKILHVISGLDPSAGGTTTALCGLVAAQHRAGLDIRVATHVVPQTDAPIIAGLRAGGIVVEALPPSASAAGRTKAASAMPALVGAADVVHIHAVWEPIQHFAAHTARRLGTPYIISPHGMIDPYNLRQKRLKKWLYRVGRLQGHLNHATAVHCTTQAEAELASPLLRRPAILIESLGVDLHEFETLPPAGTFRAAYPATGQRPILLFLGRLHAKKGLDILLAAFAKATRGDTILVLAGPDGGYEATARSMVRSLGLEEDVLFTGMLHGVERIDALVDALVMVLPSYQENFGIIVIESLACGTPVIISDQVNLHPEISPAKVGTIIEASCNALVPALNQWLSDAPMRRAAAQRARPFVWSTYDWNVIGPRWVGHYQDITGRHGSRPTA